MRKRRQRGEATSHVPQTPELLADDEDINVGGSQQLDWPGDAAILAAFGDVSMDELQEIWKIPKAANQDDANGGEEEAELVQKVIVELDEDAREIAVQVEEEDPQMRKSRAYQAGRAWMMHRKVGERKTMTVTSDSKSHQARSIQVKQPGGTKTPTAVSRNQMGGIPPTSTSLVKRARPE